MIANRFQLAEAPDLQNYLLIDSEQPEDEQVIGLEAYFDADSDSNSPERIFYHTEVSDEYSGLGLAGELVQFAVADATAKGFKIVPVCPYVKKWLTKHPEFDSHVEQVKPHHIDLVRSQLSD